MDVQISNKVGKRSGLPTKLQKLMDGIVPQALEKLFSLATRDNSISYSFSMSMLEVYMGSLRDLLAPKLPARTHETSSKCNLNIQSGPNGFVKVEGLTDVSVSDLTQASRWYTKGRRA
ncbi:hypothetical protein IFM89_000556 [Coptis chinensis]|uniref:Kinesin motor domain-containing protein n=1 Tax=Coptis chinensis TaxID=261450 RepID=A0A835IKC5_9MAGN|nr:hypothetical protein IFM89_000556 [Coptis chinensis]